jgi:hypothetical protein
LEWHKGEPGFAFAVYRLVGAEGLEPPTYAL